ncbi:MULTISPECIES: chemotaxis protein CheU [unclassified Caulobacter]|uniref:chemotaxis protein CheU n=1 Tax=unclassified Caulobacter TaxID=2648921 RepID=UPI000D387B70|nr:MULTISPECIES: chemotaxis protein CheU [unclassified Caulobacter]PTS88134.1 chemotaxis protein CheU [Caulobacter sp. HMWF009]PTT06640.1 chemotaxis protein CheU [Caulobacter sp. HMWF025]
MTAQPQANALTDLPENLLPVGELSRRLAAELMSAAAVCRDCEHIAGDLANGGAALESITRLQALDELSQRLHGLSDVLQRIGQHASGEWSLSIEPLLEGLGLADLVVRLRAAEDGADWDVEAGELDFF